VTGPAYGEITEQGSGRREALLNALSRAAQPIADAYDVWGRAVKGAFGYGPGVADDEILPAGVTLGSLAMTGSLAGVRPSGSLGAGGRIWSKEDLDRVKDLRASGLRDKQIAHEVDRSVSAVSGAARYHDLGGSQWKASSRSDQLREAWEAGKTIPEIAASTNMHPRTVQRIARDLGLPARPQGRRPKSDTTHNAMLLGELGMAGSPYDEDTFMPMPVDPQQSRANTWLNQRLDRRMDASQGMGEMHRMMSERIPHMMTQQGYNPTDPTGRGAAPGGTDMDMMLLYGPEDQVVMDAKGLPIRLDDPRHPNNAKDALVKELMKSYPQQSR